MAWVPSNLMVIAFGVLAFRCHAQERVFGVFLNRKSGFYFCLIDISLFSYQINVCRSNFIVEKL